MTILVTGGAGYVGSHVVKLLIERKQDVVVLDNLSFGHLEAIDPVAVFVKGDLRDAKLISDVIKRHRVNAVIHMAALIQVEESVRFPRRYWKTNVEYGKNLLLAMSKNNVKRIIYSSSSVVYGSGQKMPLTEKNQIAPENPYGETKAAFEKVLLQTGKVSQLKSISLRYFNAAGAHPTASIGEDHHPETHLIPNVIFAAMGKKPCIRIFGTDYPTKDGTAIRDYVHVCDLADAHILALKALQEGHATDCFNLGKEKGHSVLEVISAAEREAKRKIPRELLPRREGDVAISVASSAKIKKDLGWKPKYPSIKSIIGSAWKWHTTHPEGFRK